MSRPLEVPLLLLTWWLTESWKMRLLCSLSSHVLRAPLHIRPLMLWSPSARIPSEGARLVSSRPSLLVITTSGIHPIYSPSTMTAPTLRASKQQLMDVIHSLRLGLPLPVLEH